MERVADYAFPETMPWDTPPAPVMETLGDAAKRLRIKPRLLLRRAVSRGHLSHGPPGRPPRGAAPRLTPSLWNACKRPVKRSTTPKQPPWSAASIATLIAGWPRDTQARLLASLPGRTWSAVQNRVALLRAMGVEVASRPRAVATKGMTKGASDGRR